MSESESLNFAIPNWSLTSSSTVLERLLFSRRLSLSASNREMYNLNSTFSSREIAGWSLSMFISLDEGISVVHELENNLLRGDLCFGDTPDHGNIDASSLASSLSERRPVTLTRKSDGLKCNEHIFVRSVIWKFGETSLRIFTSHV